MGCNLVATPRLQRRSASLPSCPPSLPIPRQSRFAPGPDQLPATDLGRCPGLPIDLRYQPALQPWRPVTGAPGWHGPSTNAAHSTFGRACLRFNSATHRRTAPGSGGDRQQDSRRHLQMYAARTPARQKLPLQYF